MTRENFARAAYPFSNFALVISLHLQTHKYLKSLIPILEYYILLFIIVSTASGPFLWVSYIITAFVVSTLEKIKKIVLFGALPEYLNLYIMILFLCFDITF